MELLLEAVIEMERYRPSEKSLRQVWQRTNARISDALGSVEQEEESPPIAPSAEPEAPSSSNMFAKFAGNSVSPFFGDMCV